MHCTHITTLGLVAMLSTGCVTTFSGKGKLDFKDFPYTSVDGEPWPEHDVVLDEITAGYDLGVDARVHYVELNPDGDKTVLFVHGLGSYLKFWRYQLDAFAAQGYRVVALDLIGYGKSVKPATFPYSIDAFAEVVRAFMKKKGIDKPILVGHSMGGHTALTLAITYPDLISQLVLTAPAGFEKFSAREREWFRSVVTVGLIKGTPESGLWGSVRHSNFMRWKPDYEWLIEERARVRFADDFESYAYANVRSIVGLTFTEYTRQNLHRISVPTVIVFGSGDRLIPNRFMHGGHTRWTMQYGAERIPGAKLVELSGCGHTVQMDCSKQYNDAVLGFLAEAGAGSVPHVATTRTATTAQ